MAHHPGWHQSGSHHDHQSTMHLLPRTNFGDAKRPLAKATNPHGHLLAIRNPKGAGTSGWSNVIERAH